MSVGQLNKMQFAGSWYSSSARALTSSMQQFAESVDRKDYAAKGAVLPHAGHFYSGIGISQFFCNADKSAERLILFAPSHYKSLYADQIIYSDFQDIETPLGLIKAATLHSKDYIFTKENKTVQIEHSAEMFYPFIKQYLPDIQLMVFIIPKISSSKELEKMAKLLCRTINYNPENDLIIASSDFTHYGSRFGYTPFGSHDLPQIEEDVKTLDKKYAQLLSEGAIHEIYKQIEVDSPTICGIYPAMLAASIMKNADFSGELVSYYNSNQVTAASHDFVCYASILFHN